ncbi:MAG: SMC-Scp complex subunit ScpB [Candidatus Magasanikbacteria bacterium]|nr:SMC-Scp complex subunit ScpB [Candidatus Magasanikbacteria bacterium]
MNLNSQIESILFVASKPLTAKQIARAIQQKAADVEMALEDLKAKYNQPASGLRVLHEGDNYQMATNPENSAVVEMFIKDEAAGELTRPQLETLTVIAYRGPITRPELEQIRGVNCAIILRNLLIRGLIDEHDDEKKILPVYSLSMEAVRHLGVNTVSELPDYETLHRHEL